MSAPPVCDREPPPNAELFLSGDPPPQPCSSKTVFRAVENVPVAVSRIRKEDEKQVSFSASDITGLCDWCPVFFFSDGDCCVAGYILMEREYRLFRTDIVTEVFDGGRFIADRAEKCYRLEGACCKETYDEVVKFENIKAVEEFPLIFKSGFKSGFPDDWRDIIKETLNTLLLEIKLQQPRKGSKAKKAIELFKPIEPPNSSNVLSSSPMSFNDSLMTREEGNSTKTGPDNFTFKIVKEDDDDPVLVSEDVRELHLDRLDSGGPLELISSLKRTRSGRLVKPPLDTWRGQYLDVEGDSVTVCPGSEKDPIYLKRLGLKPKPHEDSGYLSPTRKPPRKFSRTKKIFPAGQITFTRKRRRRFRSGMPAGVIMPSSDTDSSQSLRLSLLQRASEKRIYDDELSDYSVSEKSVQVSPRTSVTCHMATQTTEEDSGIASGISTIHTSCSAVCPITRVSVFEQPMPPAPDDSNFLPGGLSPPRRQLPAVTWPKMSSSKSCHVPRSSLFEQPKSPSASDASNEYPVVEPSPPKQRTWPKMSVTRGSCCVALDSFDRSKPSMPFDSGAVALPGQARILESCASCFHPQEKQKGRCSCYSVKKNAAIKTSTPACCSHQCCERMSRSNRLKHSRLERMWRMQQEIIATMNVDLDADSETSFEHDRY